ncbi:hypothetical protein [Kibdelosporangium philippinense]
MLVGRGWAGIQVVEERVSLVAHHGDRGGRGQGGALRRYAGGRPS